MRVVIAMALMLLVSGCASGLGRPVHEVTARVDARGVQHVRLVTHSFYYEPNRIVVKANVPVELTIHNASFMVPHNFTVEGLETPTEKDVSMFHGSGTLRFTPTKPGEYRFFCDKDSHMKKGMTGTLVVTP